MRHDAHDIPSRQRPRRCGRHAWVHALALFAFVVAQGLAPLCAVAAPAAPAAGGAAAPAPPGTVRLEDGTKISIAALADIRSDKVRTGEEVSFRLTKAVEVNGVTLIEKGARVRVMVTESKHASGFGQNGRLKLRPDEVTAIDGTKVHLRGQPNSGGGSDNLALSVVGIVFLSPLFIFLQGREAVLKADVEMDAYIDESRNIAVSPAAAAMPAAALPSDVRLVLFPEQAEAHKGTSHGFGEKTPFIGPNGVPVNSPQATPSTLFDSSRTRNIHAALTATARPEDRVFEIRWYFNSVVVSATSAIMRAGGTTVSARLEHDESKPILPGAWRVDALEGGKVVATQNFVVNF